MMIENKITKKWLEDVNACEKAKEWVFSLKDKSIIGIYKQGLKEKKYYWLNWGICRLFKRKQRMQYTVYTAEQVIDIFQKSYLGDDRHRKAIEVQKKILSYGMKLLKDNKK